ncbi:MAG: peptidylprolyl isomerase [Candidatus Poseidoniales archaeon]|jgi:cyclophilin family peptidyl-prolyl cis-trans isomerase
MHLRGLGVLLVLLFLAPVVGSTAVGVQADEPAWRSVGLDPAEWTDRPDTEDSPMMESYTGNAVISMNVSYQSGWTSAREEGTVIIELFEQWAPITTNNMIAHVESGLYDGVFFHRVINDFVTQSGDPTCKTIGVYPTTSPSCGSGGTGETIPLEHDVNLSHVDGAIGMARSADPDSADSQWYIAETEAHGLDPENRDDEGYATFGIVRHGMTHIRAIADVPTSDEPTGTDLDNPFASAGRPLIEVRINSMEMIGVADPDGTIRNPVVEAQSGGSLLEDMALIIAVPLAVVLVGVGITMAVYGRFNDEDASSAKLTAEPPAVLEAEALIVAELVEGDDITDES